MTTKNQHKEKKARGETWLKETNFRAKPKKNEKKRISEFKGQVKVLLLFFFSWLQQFLASLP